MSFAIPARINGLPQPEAGWLFPFAPAALQRANPLLSTSLSSMDDDSADVPPALLDQARRGNADACRNLVGFLHPQVSQLVRSHIRRHADMEDVVQEVFLKIFVKIEQFRGPQPFTHWVARLTINTCYDWLRRQKSRPAVCTSDLSAPELALLEVTLAADAEEPDTIRAEVLAGLLERLIATLKPQEQIVIRLLDLDQRPVAEVAELTGWGMSKVKVTAFRARKKLAENLKHLESR